MDMITTIIDMSLCNGILIDTYYYMNTCLVCVSNDVKVDQLNINACKLVKLHINAYKCTQ